MDNRIQFAYKVFLTMRQRGLALPAATANRLLMRSSANFFNRKFEEG
jgi:hypothetical protein